MVKRRKKKSTRSASGICYRFGNLRIGNINHSLDKRTRRKVLTCAAFLILSVFFENGLVNCAFEIALHHIPIFVTNHFDNFCKVYGAVDFI